MTDHRAYSIQIYQWDLDGNNVKTTLVNAPSPANYITDSPLVTENYATSTLESLAGTGTEILSRYQKDEYPKSERFHLRRVLDSGTEQGYDYVDTEIETTFRPSPRSVRVWTTESHHLYREFHGQTISPRLGGIPYGVTPPIPFGSFPELNTGTVTATNTLLGDEVSLYRAIGLRVRAASVELDLQGSNPTISIVGTFTSYPNRFNSSIDRWLPENKVEYRLRIGHPSLPKSQWIMIDNEVLPTAFDQNVRDDGIFAAFIESVDLTPLVQEFSALGQSLPSVLLVEGRGLTELGVDHNTMTAKVTIAVSEDDRQCRKGDCDPPNVNTYGFPNATIGAIAGAETGIRFTGCNFEDSASSLGYGWQMSAYKRVEEDADGNLTYHDGNGMIEKWIPDGTDYIPAHNDNYIEAVKNGDGTFALTYRDQSVMQFDTLNRIESWTDSNNNVTSYTYENGPTNPGRLIKVDDGHGRETNIDYGTRTDGQPHKVSTHSPTLSDGTTVVPARETDFEYYPSGHANENRLKTITNPAGETTTYAYTTAGRLTSVTDTRGEVALAFTYHPDGRVETETSYGEARNTYTYDDPQNRMTVLTEDLTVDPSPDRETIYVYDDFRNIIEIHRKVDATTWNVTSRAYEDIYNPHLMTSEVSPNGSVTRYSYTPRGNLQLMTDALGNQTEITYAEQSDLSFAFPDAVTSIKRSDVTVEGVVTSYAETKFEYNTTTGNLEKITDALGNVTEMTHTSDGLVETIKNARGYTTEMVYGGSPRVLQTIKIPIGEDTSTDFREINFDYDGFDNVREVVDALGNKATSVYDDVDRLVELTDARNEKSVFNIINGLLDNIQSPLPNAVGSMSTRETKMIYDDSTRVREVLRDLEAGGQESRVKYDFDGFSQLTALTRKKNANDVSFEFGYDQLGRMTSAKDPLNGTTNAQTDYAYRPFCIENSVTSARGVRSVRNYDLLCRLTQVDVGDPDNTPGQELELATTRETRMFEYDELGRMVKSMMPTPNFGGGAEYGMAVYGTDVYASSGSALSQTSERNYLYDALDRLVKVTFEDNSTMEMDYDAVGNLIYLKDPEGKVTRYTYYRDNLLHKVQIERNSVIVGEFVYTYDAAGRPETVTYPEDNTNVSIVAEFKDSTGAIGWNENGQLRHLRYLRNGVPLREFEYDYDGAGNRISQIDKNPSGETHWEYTYDWFDRLKKVEKGTSAGSLLEVSVYEYDESDNMTELKLTQDMIKFIYSFDPASNLETKEERDLSDVLIETTTYNSDLDGNVTSKTVGGVTTTYDYDDFNKLVAISSGGSTLQQNDFSANGFRRSKKDSAGTITDEYASGLSTAVAKSTAETFSYIQGPGILGFEKQDGSLYYFLTDHLGSVRDIVRGTDGAVLESYDFDERGNKTVVTSGGIDSPKTFVGSLSVNDDVADSGLYLMGHRFFDSSTMRFMNRDPIGFAGGLNLFAYAGNNPTTYVDPEGLDPWSDLSIEDRAEATYRHVTGKNFVDIEYASERTGIPKRVIITLLAMERRNDALVYGDRNRWYQKPLWQQPFSDTKGPANMSQIAMDQMIEKGKIPEGTKLSECDNRESVKYGALFVGLQRSWLEKNDPTAKGVPKSLYSYELTLDDRLWIKSISYYNTFEGKNYSFGPYGEEIVRVYLMAKYGEI